MPTLHWLTREQDLKTSGLAPYRLLNHMETYGDATTENMLIQGDNLDGLKALLPYYAGKVKCIYIDPPYNTGSAFEYYDDNLEHSTWLSMMYPRIEILQALLAQDGFFICHIDDSESHYLKVICDELFGRDNYQTSFYIQVRYKDKTLKQDMVYHKQIEQALIYRNSSAAHPVRKTSEYNYDKFCYYIEELSKGKIADIGGKQVTIFKKGEYRVIEDTPTEKGLKEIWASGTILDGNSTGRFFRDYLDGRVEQDGLGVLYKVNDIGDDGLGFRYITGPQRQGATKGKYYQGIPLARQEEKNSIKNIPIENFFDFSANFGNCRNQGGVEFRSGKKPEEYLQTILDFFSSPGDLVLDSFLGSGSTAAVAHKMGRRYIGIEIGEHATTHCIPRLQKVIEGEQGGISTSINWQGGGGFRFYRLGEPIFDDEGRIRKDIRFPQLAAHVWFSETKTPWQPPVVQSPFLNVHEGTAYYLLYNGILKDKSVNGGNVLTSKIFASLAGHSGPKVIYGERCLFSPARLKQLGITFKHTPYDIKGR